MKLKPLLVPALALALSACGQKNPSQDGNGNISDSNRVQGNTAQRTEEGAGQGNIQQSQMNMLNEQRRRMGVTQPVSPVGQGGTGSAAGIPNGTAGGGTSSGVGPSVGTTGQSSIGATGGSGTGGNSQ